MIKFALQCQSQHAFESWFSSGASYDTQVKRGLVECPHCGSVKISKQIMAPSIRLGKSLGLDQPVAQTDVTSETVASTETVDSETMLKMRQFVRELHQHVEANTEDVGSTFSEEARKIHYGEAKNRGIRGRATAEQAEALAEEGIGVLPLPMLPDDRN